MTARPLRDSDIRKLLERWLQKKYSGHDETKIMHELRMQRPTGRVDIAVINGRLSGFEIKSDFDSLTRLPRQIRAFSAVFDDMCVVTTRRHVTNTQKLIPAWWRLTVKATKNGRIH